MSGLVIFIKDYMPTYGIIFKRQGADPKHIFQRRWSGHLEKEHFEQNLFTFDVINLHVSSAMLM